VTKTFHTHCSSLFCDYPTFGLFHPFIAIKPGVAGWRLKPALGVMEDREAGCN